VQALGNYVLQITTAALIVGFLTAISGANKQVRWVGSLVLILTVLSPADQAGFNLSWKLADEFQNQAWDIVNSAQDEANLQVQEGIIQRVQAYILDEAESIDAKVCVVSVLLDEQSLLPLRVELQGRISSDQRIHLSEMMCEDLGVGKEGQIWRE